MKFNLKDGTECECTNIFFSSERDLQIQWKGIQRSDIADLLSDKENLSELTFNDTTVIGYIQPTYIQEFPLEDKIVVNLIRNSSEETIKFLEKKLSDVIKEQKTLSDELLTIKEKIQTTEN